MARARVTERMKEAFNKLTPVVFDPASNMVRVHLGGPVMADLGTMAMDSTTARTFAALLIEAADQSDTDNVDRIGEITPEENRPEF